MCNIDKASAAIAAGYKQRGSAKLIAAEAAAAAAAAGCVAN